MEIMDVDKALYVYLQARPGTEVIRKTDPEVDQCMVDLEELVCRNTLTKASFHSCFMAWLLGNICSQPDNKDCPFSKAYYCLDDDRCVPFQPEKAYDPFPPYVIPPHTNPRQQMLNVLTTMRTREGNQIERFGYKIYKCCSFSGSVTFDVNTRDLERIHAEVEKEFSLSLCMGTHSRLGADSPFRMLSTDMIMAIMTFYLKATAPGPEERFLTVI